MIEIKTSEIPLYTYQSDYKKRNNNLIMSSAGEDAEKLEFSHLLVQMVQNYVYTYKKVCKTGKI